MPSARKVKRRDPATGKAVATGQWQGVAEVPEGLQARLGKKQDSKVVEQQGRAGQAAARRWAENREREFAAMLTRPDASDVYIEQWYDRVRDSLPHTGRTPAEVAALLRVFWIPKWGEIPVQEWDPAEARSWISRLQHGPRPGDRLPEPRRHPKACDRGCRTKDEKARHVEDLPDTYRTVGPERARSVVVHLKALLARAVVDGVLDRSPLESVQPPSPPKASQDDVRLIPEQDFLAAVRHLPDWCRDFVYGLAYTGLRLGEANALIDDVYEAGQRVLTVANTIIEDDSCSFAWKLFPKSARRRSVPIPLHVAEVYARRGRHAPLVLPIERGGGKTMRAETWYRTPEGNAFCRHRLDDEWKKAQRAAGIKEPYRIHDLRHLYASMLIAAGRSLLEVAELMGHSHTRVTELYSHLTAGWRDGAREALERTPMPVTDGDAEMVPEAAEEGVRAGS